MWVLAHISITFVMPNSEKFWMKLSVLLAYISIVQPAGGTIHILLYCMYTLPVKTMKWHTEWSRPMGIM